MNYDLQFYPNDEGFYMASNIDNSCKLWNTFIKSKSDIVPYGACEHMLSKFIATNTNTETCSIKKNELMWISEGCPHEAILQTHNQFR